jgi:hypothetical protein
MDDDQKAELLFIRCGSIVKNNPFGEWNGKTLKFEQKKNTKNLFSALNLFTKRKRKLP